MLKQRSFVALLLALIAPSMILAAGPTFVDGDLGQLQVTAKADGAFQASAKAALEGVLVNHFGAMGDEDLEIVRVNHNDDGTSFRFEQSHNGLKVYGASIAVMADASGKIFAVNADFIPSSEFSTVIPKLAAEEAVAFAFGKASFPVKRSAEAPELAYVYDGRGATLSWNVVAEYTDGEGNLQRDRVFVDAATGEIAARHPEIHYARVLRTYDCNNGTSCGSLWSSSSNRVNSGGTLALRSAHNYAVGTYDYLNNNFGRDSLNNAGMTLRSRVHYSNNYNNAFWDGTQMTYGDGDGTTFVPLSQDADVVAHEFTHGVTEFDSGLIYQNESGALNEAWSDIIGALVDRQEGATGADIWLIGEDIYTPGTPGDALRSMADPVAQGDYDYYPTRYTGSQDNGGVHWNSGIANLAFQLLVDGGTHPRGKTSVSVTGIGFTQAARIFYEANRDCFSQSSNFSAARSCTTSEANSIYGSATRDLVHCAWDAVGVPGSSTCGGAPPPPPPPPPPTGGGTLTKGVPATGLSGSTGSTQTFTLSVPSGASNLTFTMSGGTGDADLYTRFGSAPTTSTYDCRPYLNGNNESCTVASPSTGTYYAMIRAYSTFSGVSLVGDYTAGSSCAANSGSASNTSATTGNWNYYTWTVPTGCSSATFSISGGTGDADLYTRLGSNPTTSTYSCRPYKNGNNESCTTSTTGTWHLGVRAYSTFSGVNVSASHN